MKANAVPLLALFEKKIRLEIPLFQRQYVWNREQQWELLWEDIARKFTEYLEGRKDSPVHFLGAMVLDQKLTPSTHVDRRQVIDGQQRLTTLQIFLAALRDFCFVNELEQLAKEFESYTTNKGMMANPEVDKYKIWPTQLDRPQFTDVLGLGSKKAIEGKHPLVKVKYARKPEPRPRMVEAYLYFYSAIEEYFLGTETDPPLAADQPLANRIEEALQALKNALQVVAIDLEPGDDAQVIFETLNARGEPLLPADLLRNYIFLRAARANEPQEELYEKYWRGFDEEFWRTEVRQGRLTRPRSDLFMQHFLSSKQAVDIPIKHLFVEYRYWIERQMPFDCVRTELATVAKQRDDFRRILEPKKDDFVFSIATFVEDFDVRTVYPLLLFLLDAKINEADWHAISTTVESYILRRFFTGGATNSYGRIFLSLIKALQKSEVSPANLSVALSKLSGETSTWPTDSQFAAAWHSVPAYKNLNNAKLVHILTRLNDSYFNIKNERLVIDNPMTVEHIMPQSWIQNWRLQNGLVGMNDAELDDAPESEPRAVMTIARNAAVQSIGNLTLLTQPLNSTVTNSDWGTKKSEFALGSLLPINGQLQKYADWTEIEIRSRSEELLKRAIQIWPGPTPK